ncbi:hypothetical protein [Streptomyces sp. NPDC006739]|uniref:hypothetical protein n=1 Tax=Streptomyces sp. NPDC006739 TaxID=3364763 RepID=UPI0036A6932F
MTEPTETEDTCRHVEIDGETIRVRGAAEMSDQSREALGALIRVAKEKFAAENPPTVVTDPERRERYAAALYNTLEVSPARHPWETLSPLRRAVWYARADAAMRLADDELQQERDRLFAPLHRAEADNARLRAAAPAVPAPATGQTAAPTDWIDGHPQLEAIAAAVWEHCGRSDSGTCVEDDPRNIAVAALAAVLPAPDPTIAAERDSLGGEADRLRKDWVKMRDRAERAEARLAVVRAEALREAADALPGADLPFVPPMDRRRVADWLRRLAGEARQDPHSCGNCDGVDPDSCLFNPDRPAGRAAEAELYVLLRKAGEGRYEAQACIDRHRDEVLRRQAAADELAREAQDPTQDGADVCSGCRYVPCGTCPTAVARPGQPETDTQPADTQQPKEA